MSVSWRKIPDVRLSMMVLVHTNVLTDNNWIEIKQAINQITAELQGDFITECSDVKLILIICVDHESESFIRVLRDVKQGLWKNHYPIGIAYDTKKLSMIWEYEDWGGSWRKSVRKRIVKVIGPGLIVDTKSL